VHGKPSVMLSGKARSLPLSGAPFRYCILGQAPGLTHKHETILERFVRDKDFTYWSSHKL
jgi:hypothetical protein